MINTDLFPDMAGLVDHGHALDIKMGWYQNACGCPEPELHKNCKEPVTFATPYACPQCDFGSSWGGLLSN